MQKAYEFSKEAETETPLSQNITDNIRKERLGKISNVDVKKST
jgi:hypothetical protein